MTTKQARERQEAIDYLRELIKPGDTVYTILKHVSRSGMYRVIDLYVMIDNQPRRISNTAADLLGGYDYKHEGCKASGCGMDMGFHLVYNLSYALYPEYKCLKPGKCPSSDHQGRDYDKVFDNHSDGYAILQSWMG